MTLSQPVAEAVVFGLAITLVWSGLVGAARRLPPGPRRDAAREALRWCLAVTLGLALMFVVATVWSWASLQAADRVTSGRATTTFLRGVWRTVLALPLFGALPTLGFLGAMAVGRWIGREARLPSAAVSVGRVAFGAAGAVLGSSLYRTLVDVSSWLSGRRAGLFDGLEGSSLALVVGVGVAAGVMHWMLERRQARRDAAEAARRASLEAEVTAARLAALEARLRPHALLNALGGLARLIRTDPDAAEAMTLALARLLRRTLATADAPTVPLADELALVADYLAVEQHRLGDRLRVAVDVPENLRTLAVPRLALQPIVENAVVHGAGRTSAPVRVVLRATQVGERLHVTVEDNGPPFVDGWTGGTGLTSVGERLRLLWGADASLRIEASPKRVVLDLPADSAPPRSAPAAR